MGCLLFINKVQQDMQDKGVVIPDSIVDLCKGPILTASMNVKFVRPTATPQVVMATVTFQRMEGRKFSLGYNT